MSNRIFDGIRSFFSSLRGETSSVRDGGDQPMPPVTLKRPFTLLDEYDKSDPMIREVMERDLQGLDTPLELMKRYADSLNKATSHGNIDEKLDKLFLAGRVPESLDGYYHGVTISLRTGTDS